MAAIVLNLKPFVELSDDQFYELCQNHRHLKFERTAQGELVIVPPKFPPICPDFVIELRSESDALEPLKLNLLPATTNVS